MYEPHRFRCSVLAASVAAVAVVVAIPSGTEAIPVFAREYQTSCQTCHIVFPELNAFGEAFRRNGYRFPAGEDDDASWDEPIALGQPAHARVFPDAVWPGQAPGSFPATATVNALARFIDGEEGAEVDLGGFGGRVGITVAGALDRRFSGWAGLAVSAEQAPEGESFDVELERVFMSFHPLDQPYVYFRAGRFEPTVAAMTVHRTLGPAPWVLTSPIADNAFTIDPSQLGVEVAGIVGTGRLTYAAGAVEGNGNAIDRYKDVYGRLAYKIGGMRADGWGGATAAQPWQDDSLVIGAFAMGGRARIGEEGLATQVDAFYLAGGDIVARWGDFSLTGIAAFGRNERPSLAAPESGVTTVHGLAQLEYVAWPWFVPLLRYEYRNIENIDEMRVSPSVYALLRANVRMNVTTSLGVGNGSVELDQVLVGLNTAF